MTPDLVVLGNLLVDDVVLRDGCTRMAEPGGAALYCCLGARLWGARTGCVSVRGEDYPEWAWQGMAERGVDLGGVRPLGRPGLRIWLLYEDVRRQIVLRLDRPSHAEMSPGFGEIPEAWRAARLFHVSPMALDAQEALVRELARLPGAFVSLDPFAFVTEATLPRWRTILPKVDALFLSEDELEIPFADARDAGRTLCCGRLRYLVLKRGDRGGVVYDARSDEIREWQARADGVVDPTGAGDVFATSFLVALVEGQPLPAALRRAVVGTSFVLADHGPRALLAAEPEQAARRLAEWYPE
jgi:sugar/nucleoside kinase (ribokinase family)